MKHTTRIQSITALAALVLLAACGTSESHHSSYAGTPSDWYSGSYMAMLDDAKSEQPMTMASKKPVRLRLY